MLSRRAGLLSLMIWCIVLPWLSLQVPISYAQTRGQSITVQSRSYAVHFPGSIDFYATVSDSGSPIVRASLNLSVGPDQNRELQNVQVARPQRNVTLHWREDTGGNHFLPAGTPISYYWQIWDSAGNTLTDASQSLTTIDTRFQWQHLTQGLLQVNWYGRTQSFGQMLLKQAGNSVAHISSVLGSGLLHPINLWAYANDADFHGSLAPGSYEWVGGEALPSLREASIVVATASDYTLVRDMPHELTHLIFHQLIERGIYPPTWFDEGIAVYDQIFREPDMLIRFKEALSTNSLLRLDSISIDFPSDSDKAYLAYAQSWQLVTYMYDTFGRAKMAKLIHNLGDTRYDFDSALKQALGVDHLHLENQWRLALHQPGVLAADQTTPTPTSVGTATSTPNPAQSGGVNLLWIFGGLGIIILVEGCIIGIWLAIKRRRRAQFVPSAPVYPAYPTYPAYPAGWNQPNQPPVQGAWPGSFNAGGPGAQYPRAGAPGMPPYAQPGVPVAPYRQAKEYAPVPWRVPQE